MADLVEITTISREHTL